MIVFCCGYFLYRCAYLWWPVSVSNAVKIINLMLNLYIFFCVYVSKVFLINVLRVIVRKLHPQSAQPAPLAIRKAVRATIILVRVFVRICNKILLKNLIIFLLFFILIRCHFLVYNIFCYPTARTPVPPWKDSINCYRLYWLVYRVLWFHFYFVLPIMMLHLLYVVC